MRRAGRGRTEWQIAYGQCWPDDRSHARLRRPRHHRDDRGHDLYRLTLTAGQRYSFATSFFGGALNFDTEIVLRDAWEQCRDWRLARVTSSSRRIRYSLPDCV